MSLFLLFAGGVVGHLWTIEQSKVEEMIARLEKVSKEAAEAERSVGEYLNQIARGNGEVDATREHAKVEVREYASALFDFPLKGKQEIGSLVDQQQMLLSDVLLSLGDGKDLRSSERIMNLLGVMSQNRSTLILTAREEIWESWVMVWRKKPSGISGSQI